MRNFLRVVVFSIVLIIFNACGGGGSSSNNNPSINTAKGVAQLGYISDGNISLYKLSDLTKPIASVKTAISQDLDKVGRFEIKNISLNPNEYYLVTVSGGDDVDTDDNGVLDTNTTKLEGTVHCIASGDMLKNGISINAYSDMIFEKISKSISTMSNTQIKEFLDTNAQKYLFDINKDNKVDYHDIVKFNPINDKDKTKNSYQDILDLYVNNLHINAKRDRKLASLMYIDNPTIVVENGRLQEVPFLLKAKLSNEPKGLNIKWSINGKEKTEINENISDDGIYTITANLYDGNKSVKTVSTSVIATAKKEIASAHATVDKASKILVDVDSNSSLEGTQIYIPKGALKEDTKIVVKKVSVNAVPSDGNGISISDVLVLEPSGLKFDKPVQVRMPYDSSLDLNKSNIRIARYSQGGKIDYIAPLYVDKDAHEIVFETEHFTEFELQEDGKILKTTDLELEDIKNITKINNYSDEKWEEILNTNVINEDTTVYDLYIKYKLHKKIVDLMNKGKYHEAYELFYSDPDSIQHMGDLWESYAKVVTDTKSITGTYSTVKEHLKTIFITKKYYKQIASDLGIVTDMDPMSFVTEYVENVFKQAYQILKIADYWSKKDAFSLFFKYKESNPKTSINEILDELQKSYDNPKANMGLFGKDMDFPMTHGWLGGAGYSRGTLSFQSSKQYYLSLNALWELRENFQKKLDEDSILSADEQHIKDLKDIILSIAHSMEVNELGDNKSMNFIGQSGFKYFNEGEKLNIDYKMHLYGYDKDQFLRIKIFDDKNRLLVDDVSSFCNIDKSLENYDENSLDKICEGSIDFDTNTLKADSKYIILKLYKKKNLGFQDEYLGKDLYIHLKKKNPKIKSNIKNINVNGHLQEDGLFYTVNVTPEFDTVAKPPVNIIGTYKGETVGSSFKVLKNDFDRDELSNIPFTISLKDDAKDAYELNDFYTTKDIKSLIVKALKQKEADKPQETLSNPELIASNYNIEVGEKVVFEIKKENIKKVIRRIFGGNVKDISTTTVYKYEVTYNNTGSFTPMINVLLKDGRSISLQTDDIVVTKKKDETETATVTNTAPIIKKKFQIKQIYENTSGSIEKMVYDLDGDSFTIEITHTPSHGEVVENGKYLVYTPEKDYTGEDSFKYIAKDKYGAKSKEALVSIEVIKTKPVFIEQKAVELVSTSEPKDTCGGSFWNSGCEAKVYPGDTFIKTWTFKNIGNVDLKNIRVMQDISDSKSLVTTMQTSVISTLKVGKTGKISIKIFIPKNTASGVYKARYKLVDNDGDLNYKSTNGPSYFWYMLNVLPSFPKTITLQNVKNDGGLEGEVFTFSAVTSEPLDNSYKLMLSLGDNGGGWLAPKDMIPNSDRKKFAKAIKITKAGVNDGTRKYRVAIFYNGQQQSAWIEGSYKVYASSKIPQNLTAKQTTDGVLLSWSAVNGAKQYNPMASLNFKKDGNYATISSCEFKSDTSCLVDEHWFKEHKEWYFAIQADTYPMSEPIKFVWNDAVAPENKYSKYLADKTLYSVDNNSTVTEWAFDKDLSEITINSGEKTIAVKLDDNGLKIVSKENDYLIIKSVEDDYVVVEWVELTENGVILSHKGSAKLYFKDPTQGADLATLIVGKTFYQYCSQNKELITLTFGKDGDLVVKGDQETEHIPYTIKDNVLYVDEDGKKETHVLTKSDINYIQFGSKDEDKFYTNESDARANPVSDCDDDSDEIKVTNFISGHVDFVDKGYVPSDAWIGIVPSRYQNDASGWNRVTCKINSNGDFGNECYINHNEQGINEAFADSSETFQIVVFKNNVKSNEHDWNCGEDVYKYVGSNEPKDSWAHITVKDEDYQDRSDEECSDEKDIYTYTFDLDNQKFSGKSYSSSYVDHEVVHFNISTGNNKSLLISTTFKTNNELLNAFGSNNVLYLDNSKITGVKFGDISTYNDTSEGGIESGSLKLIISEDKQQIHILQNNATIKISNKVLTGLDAYFARTNKVYNNNNDNQKDITKIEYSFNGDFLNDIGYCGTLSENDIILVGNSGSLVGWHNENYPLQMIIVLESDFSKLKCFMYDFHKYHNNEMGAGQNGTDEEMPEKSVVSQDSLLLKGSYSFTFDGMLDNDWNFKGSWYQEASDINGNYSGSGDFEIKLKRLNITDNNDNQKISDLVSGHLSFVDEDGNSISVPSNAWIRITPKEHQIEGSWNGVNCKINSSGNFGQECYIHSDEQEMRELFKSSAHTSYQIVIYKETIEDTRYNSEEEGIGDIIVDDDIESQKFDYGAWSNARVKIYTNDQNNNSSSNSKSVTYDVGNSLSVTISLNNNQLKAVFNKDMKSSYSTSGNYKPEKSFWLDDRTFVMDLEYYDAGGSIKFDADGFETTDGENMDKDIIFIFPQ